MPLWANGAPASEGKTAPEVVTQINVDGEHTVTSINAPSISPYLVRGAKAPVAAVIIAPGGGHSLLSIDHEGYDVAKYLSGHGVAAFVLKYRLAKEKGSTYTVEGSRAYGHATRHPHGPEPRGRVERRPRARRRDGLLRRWRTRHPRRDSLWRQ